MDAVIEQAGLEQAARRKAGGYSLGMRQRLGIAAAMLGDPPALMLDEPFNGMDPEGIVWMRAFLRSLAAEGRSVLVSSHLMSELQDTADHLVVVGRGKVIADTTVADLIAAASGDQVVLRTSAPGGGGGARSRGGHRRRHRQRRADGHRTRRREGDCRAGTGGRALLRGLSAPREPGSGLPGTHPGRGRVPRRRACR